MSRKILPLIIIAAAAVGAYVVYNRSDRELPQIHSINGNYPSFPFPEREYSVPPLPLPRELRPEDYKTPPPSPPIPYPSQDSQVLKEDWKTFAGELNIFEGGGRSLSFTYPAVWGSLTLKETYGNGEIQFTSDNKNVQTVWYHRPSGTVVAVRNGKFYPSGSYVPSSPDGKADDYYEDIVTVYSPLKGIKDIFNDKPWEEVSRFGTSVGKIGFSPDGRYLDLKRFGWEWATHLIIDTAENRDILSDSIIGIGDIYWSPDGNVLSMRSYYYGFDGSGIDGIFVSEFGRPENLREVFTWGEEERAGLSVFQNIQFLSNEHLQFSARLKRCVYQDNNWSCNAETIRKFIFFVKTGQLREL